MIDDIDKEFISKVNECIVSQRVKDAAFDRMEMEADLYEKFKLTGKINSSTNILEIMDLWQKFKVIERRTRPHQFET